MFSFHGITNKHVFNDIKYEVNSILTFIKQMSRVVYELANSYDLNSYILKYNYNRSLKLCVYLTYLSR